MNAPLQPPPLPRLPLPSGCSPEESELIRRINELELAGLHYPARALLGFYQQHFGQGSGPFTTLRSTGPAQGATGPLAA